MYRYSNVMFRTEIIMQIVIYLLRLCAQLNNKLLFARVGFETEEGKSFNRWTQKDKIKTRKQLELEVDIKLI